MFVANLFKILCQIHNCLESIKFLAQRESHTFPDVFVRSHSSLACRVTKPSRKSTRLCFTLFRLIPSAIGFRPQLPCLRRKIGPEHKGENDARSLQRRFTGNAIEGRAGDPTCQPASQALSHTGRFRQGVSASGHRDSSPILAQPLAKTLGCAAHSGFNTQQLRKFNFLRLR